MSFDGLYVGSQSFINTLLQRGVLRVTETQTRFNGFYGLSKTAEAVSAAPPPSCTPLKQGVNEKKPLRMARFGKYSGTGSNRRLEIVLLFFEQNIKSS